MISNSKQTWEVGQAVRVGFLNMIVKAAIPTPGDGMPDAYILTNKAGDKLYAFVPHNGVRRIDTSEAFNMLEAARRHADKVAARATAQAARAARVSLQIANLFAEVV